MTSMPRRRPHRSAATALVILGLLGSACARTAPDTPTSAAATPLSLQYDHLRHLSLTATMNGRSVRAIALYANAPAYRPTGSPARDGYEGIASVDDAARAAVLYLHAYEETREARFRDDARGLLQFIASMEQGDGEFLNFIDASGQPNRSAPSSRKSMSYWAARSIWALGEAEAILPADQPDSAGGNQPGIAALDLHRVLERAVARMAREVDAGRLIGGSATATSEALLGLLALQRAHPTPEQAATPAK